MPVDPVEGRSKMRNLPALVALSGTLALGGTSTAATISLELSKPVVAVGELLEVDLVVAGLGRGEAPSLGTYSLELLFDGSRLSGLEVMFGDGLNVLGQGTLRGTGITAGSVKLAEESFDSPGDLDALQPDTFTLATIVLEGFTPGESDLSLVVSGFADVAGDPIPWDPPGSAAVRVVPEPETAALLLLGLSALAVKRRASLDLDGATARSGRDHWWAVRDSNPGPSD